MEALAEVARDEVTRAVAKVELTVVGSVVEEMAEGVAVVTVMGATVAAATAAERRRRRWG